MAVVYSKVLLFDPPLIYTAPDICVFGAVLVANRPSFLFFFSPTGLIQLDIAGLTLDPANS